MTTPTRQSTAGDGHPLSLEERAARVGVAALLVTKTMDVLTTLFALRFVPRLEEQNPVAVAAMRTLGAPVGILALALLAVVAVVAATEYGARLASASTDAPRWTPAVVRLIGYGPLSVLNVGVALYNAALIVRVVGT